MAFKYKGLRLKDPTLLRKLKRVLGVTFTRASVAYDKNGNTVPVNTPRFGMFNGPDDGILIEEAHTNLLSADASLSLTGASPYTTGTLNGTYTFTCRTGSYELSGGATGTVTPTTPQTKAITSATVTLTGTSTYNQIINKAYPLSFTLGGTTHAGEQLIIPGNIANIDTSGGTPNTGSGTIEFKVYVNNTIRTLGMKGGLISILTPINELYIWRWDGDTKYYLHVFGTATEISQTILSEGPHTFKIVWDSISFKLFCDGVQVGSTVLTPTLAGSAATNVKIGSRTSTGYQCNTLISDVAFSRPKRGDSDLVRRSLNSEPVVDKEVTFIMPLKNDLRAYRVRT